MKLFRTLVVDPPWPYASTGSLTGFKAGKKLKLNGEKAKGVSAAAVYPLMPMEALLRLRVGDLAAPRAHLYLWVTNSFLAEGHQLAKAWGFVPKTLLTWAKVKQDGTPSMKMGFWYRSASEHILFCSRGKAMRLLGPPAPTVYLVPRVRAGAHSKKPGFFYKLVERQSPGPYVEVFARRPRPGWDFWGNQVNSSVVIGGAS